MKLAILGCGNLGKAIVKSARNNNFDILITNKTSTEYIPYTTRTDNITAVQKSKYIFLCVKPDDVVGICQQIKSHLKPYHIIVSTAAGLPLIKLQNVIPNQKIIKIMPTLPIMIKSGIVAVYYPSHIYEFNVNEIKNKFFSGSTVIKFETEAEMDEFTVVAACGVGFIADYINRLKTIAIKDNKIKEHLLKYIIKQTAIGTMDLLKLYTEAEIVAMVTSPNGATAEGIKNLDNNNINTILSSSNDATISKLIEIKSKFEL